MSRVERELARRVPPGEVFVRAAHLGQGIDGAELLLDLAACRPLEQVAQWVAHHRLRSLEAVHEPEAHHAAALAHQPAGAEVVLLARRDPVYDDAAERSKRLGAL